MIYRSCFALPLLFLSASAVMAQTTRPTSSAANLPLDVRALAAFNEGQYALALPMLKQVVSTQTDPQRIGSLEEEIRVCEKNIADGLGTPPVGPTIAMSAETRVPHKVPPKGTTLAISIKELGNFNYDEQKGGNIPADVKALTGSKLRLCGFMLPMDEAENITQFALVPSLFSCCNGQPPQIQHTIVVNCPKGKAVAYCPDEIVVEGTLNVQEKKDDDYIVSIFELQCSSVHPVPN